MARLCRTVAYASNSDLRQRPLGSLPASNLAALFLRLVIVRRPDFHRFRQRLLLRLRAARALLNLGWCLSAHAADRLLEKLGCDLHRADFALVRAYLLR